MGNAAAAGAVTVHVMWQAAERDMPRLTEILAEMRALVREEPGCRAFEAWRVQGASRFVLIETYRDEEAAVEHRATPYYQRLILGEAHRLLGVREVQRLEAIAPAT